MRLMLWWGLLCAPIIGLASPVYPRTETGQQVMILERGFIALSVAAQAYAFDNCAFPVVMDDVSPAYTFHPVEAGLGIWHVGVNALGNQGYVCYSANSSGVARDARTAVKRLHPGLIVSDVCGAAVSVAVDPASEALTWWLPTMTFPTDCIVGP